MENGVYNRMQHRDLNLHNICDRAWENQDKVAENGTEIQLKESTNFLHKTTKIFTLVFV